MGHNVSGFVARLDDWGRARQFPVGLQLCGLNLRWGLLTREIPGPQAGDDAADIAAFCRLTRPMFDWAIESSRCFPLAYFETEYHGGAGSQAAAAWAGGVVVAGPFLQADEDCGKGEPSEWPINRVLRHLGVVRSKREDEFDAVGLGRWRNNEDWIRNGGV